MKSKKLNVQKFALNIPMSAANPQMLEMSPDEAVKMLLHYFPKQTKSLLERAMSKAHADRRISLDRDYHASFQD